MKSLLSQQFRESILAVSTALNAGYSVENSFIEAYHDMQDMYGNDAVITEEYKKITAKLRDNEQIEYVLRDFALRSDIEDIKDFAEVFEAAKRIGGDMNKIIRRAAENISDKIDVKREIETSMSSKITEARIMELVPFGILIYLQMGSESFLSVLYNCTAGRMMMTVALLVYLSGVIVAEKILDIEV
ncbi:MAG: type II secretion system F family protein [Lachnospiraceae bacterium]|nr:type II secretion system F family protein [Lachnospiraceae bacterium]